MTLSTYLTATNIVQETVPRVVVDNGCGPQAFGPWTAPSRPTVTQATYRPYEVEYVAVDPSRGRRFNRLRNDGSILMSPLTKSKVVTERFISSCDIVHSHAAYWTTGRCHETGNCATAGPFPARASWTENAHFESLSHLPLKGRSLADYQSDVADAVSSTQQQAYASALNGYDLLTEMGEMRETLSYLLGKVGGIADAMSKFKDEDPQAWNNGKSSNAKKLLKHADKAFKKLGGRWMEYRYAIMPLVYSIKDVSEVLEKRTAMYHSERAKEVISLDSGFFLKTDDALHQRLTGSITVSSLTKARYTYGSVQRLASVIGMNPFRTAWELIPLSFVVDWALNVGDAISVATGIDYSSQRAGCTSVRTQATEEVYHFRLVDHRGPGWDWGTNSCGYNPGLWIDPFHREYENLVLRRVTDSYHRTLFDIPKAGIILNPSMTWKRWVDATVLGYRPTQKLLRSLK